MRRRRILKLLLACLGDSSQSLCRAHLLRGRDVVIPLGSSSSVPSPWYPLSNPLGWRAGFANEGQFLLMNSASLADMNARIAAQAGNRKKRTASNVGEVSRFRPNLLVGGSGVAAYAEDGWLTVRIGMQRFFTAGETLQMASCVSQCGLPGATDTKCTAKMSASLGHNRTVLCISSTEKVYILSPL